MNRRVEPELLDELPPNDPDAVASRRDLRSLNFLMGHAAIVARVLLESAAQPPRWIVELGAGDGTFLLAVARRLARQWRNVEAVLLDRQNIVAERTRAGFRKLGWTSKLVQADVFDWLARSPEEAFDCTIVNLFLHHFPDVRLRKLLSLASERTNCFVACEPRRAPTVLGVSGLLWMIGCNSVTRHDAVASVRAGFIGEEIMALWPKESLWDLRESETRLFSHCFVALRALKCVGDDK
jgi:hypothetical protein